MYFYSKNEVFSIDKDFILGTFVTYIQEIDNDSVL